MSPPNAQHEPTMEEILASIRKIISDDQPEPPKAAPQAAAVLPSQAASSTEVLELTHEMKDEGEENSVVAPLAMETAKPEAQPAREEEPIKPVFKSVTPRVEEVESMANDDLISDAARDAVGSAFRTLDDHGQQEPQQQAAPQGPAGSLDAAFENAVRSAFEPALHEWVDSRSNAIMEQLKPLIRQWMDDNLPALIENAVRNEIARAVRTRGR